MSFKILGGQFKGRQLHSPKGTSTRPTLGILRQALFNICQQSIEGAYFLDLFAGSGAMGLEALSRGAAQAVFVEQHRLAVRAIRENIQLLHLEAYTELFAMDLFAALKQLEKKNRPFDLIYIDPPYASMPSIGLRVLTALEKSALLAEHCSIFVEESSTGEALSYQFKSLRQKDVRVFGAARLHQFER